LSGANLIEVDLSNSIIINLKFDKSWKLNKNTNFANAISNNLNIIYNISQFTENIPEIVNSKKELRLKLNRKLDEKKIDYILSMSTLPEE
jgi:hypothetical protein